MQVYTKEQAVHLKVQGKENLLLCDRFQGEFASTLLQSLDNFFAISAYSPDQNCTVFFKNTGRVVNSRAGKDVFKLRNSTNERTNSAWANLGWKVKHF